MKSDEPQLDLLFKTMDNSLLDHLQLNDLKGKTQLLIDSNKQVCVSNKKGKQYCIEEKCKHYAIVCGDEDCQCNINHQECANFYKINKLNHQILKNVKSTDIDQEITKSIMSIKDSFHDLEDELLKEIEYCGLSSEERSLIKYLQADYGNILKNQEQFKPLLTSKAVKECLRCLSHVEDDRVQLICEQLCDLVQRQKNKVCKELDAMVKIIERKFSNRNQQKNDWKDSKIIRTQDQTFRLNKFMEEEMNKFKRSELIFRATTDGMQMEQFYSKCGNKPNLLFLVENEFGKKYGGFTPCQISLDRMQKHENDPSMRSFIFSIDANTKAMIANKQHSIRNGIKDKSQQTLVGFGFYDPCNLVIGANSLTEQEINWITFFSPYDNSSYETSPNPPEDILCCGTRRSKCKLREVEVYQLMRNRRGQVFEVKINEKA